MTEKEIEEKLKEINTVDDLRKISQTESELYKRAAEKINAKSKMTGGDIKESAENADFILDKKVKEKFPKLYQSMASAIIKKGKMKSEQEQKEEEERKRQKYYKG